MYKFVQLHVSEIGAVVMVVNSHLCGWSPIPGKTVVSLIVMKLITVFHVHSDQHVKYWIPREFPLTSTSAQRCGGKLKST